MRSNGLFRQRGLTLIELLVAITVLAFIAVLGWRGLDGIVRARIALTGDLEQTRGMQLAFAQLQSDCAHLAPASLIPGRVPLLAEENRLKLVRLVYTDNQPARLQVVAYRLDNGVLTRSESAGTRDLRKLDLLWQGGVAENQAVELLSGVAAFSLRLWVSGRWHTVPEIIHILSTSAVVENPASILPPTPAGLEVAMRLEEREMRLLKIFLLGAV